MSETLDLPLKPAQDTFTDDPNELDDVNIHDLVYDIENNAKDINKLHIFEAISIFAYSLQDIIRLQQDPERFQAFRKAQLAKRNIHGEIAGPVEPTNDAESLDNAVPAECPVRSATPPSEPPAKMLKTTDSSANFNTLRTNTPDSLEEAPEAHIIDIEELVKTTDLQRSYSVDFDDISKELAYHHDAKIVAQNAHVLKCFNLVTVPGLTVQQFLSRVHTYSSSISVSCYIHAAFMVYKLCVLLDVIPLTMYNVHRLILASVRCSTKKLEDVYQKQKAFATVGGVSQKDLFKIEVNYLFLSNFRIVVGQDSLNNYLKEFAELRTYAKDLPEPQE